MRFSVACLLVATSFLSLHAEDGAGTDPASLETRAQEGDADAQFALAIRYRDGMGIAKNKGFALSWFREAWAQGHAGAEKALQSFPVKKVTITLRRTKDGNTCYKVGNREVETKDALTDLLIGEGKEDRLSCVIVGPPDLAMRGIASAMIAAGEAWVASFELMVEGETDGMAIVIPPNPNRQAPGAKPEPVVNVTMMVAEDATEIYLAGEKLESLKDLSGKLPDPVKSPFHAMVRADGKVRLSEVIGAMRLLQKKGALSIGLGARIPSPEP